LDGRSAIAGAEIAERWTRLFFLAAVVPILAACGATLHSRPSDAPADATRAEVAATDALNAPSNESPAGVPRASEPPSDAAPANEPPREPAAEPQSPTEPSDADNVLEGTRRSVRSTAVWLASGVDSWFGDKPFAEGGEVKDGRLSVGFLKRQSEGVDTRIRFNARLRLPNVERRAYLFIGLDNDREVVADTPGAFSRQDRLLSETPDERSFFTGLGLSLRDNFDLRLGFHGIKPYTQARYRQPWTLSERDQVEFRQTFFWRISDRLGSTTALSYEHALASDLALRWLTASTITQKAPQFDWSSIVGAYKSFGGERLLSLELIASGRLSGGATVGEYGAQTKWLQPFYRDWLLGEFLAGYFWPRLDLAHERTHRWALGFSTIMRF